MLLIVIASPLQLAEEHRGGGWEKGEVEVRAHLCHAYCRIGCIDVEMLNNLINLAFAFCNL